MNFKLRIINCTCIFIFLIFITAMTFIGRINLISYQAWLYLGLIIIFEGIRKIYILEKNRQDFKDGSYIDCDRRLILIMVNCILLVVWSIIFLKGAVGIWDYIPYMAVGIFLLLKGLYLNYRFKRISKEKRANK